MRASLGILLLASAAYAQDGGISASGAPKAEKSAAPATGRVLRGTVNVVAGSVVVGSGEVFVTHVAP